MKAVILAGGIGSRISEESAVRPKPMVEIGGRPILWHILKLYSAFDINDFVVCLGYKGYVIKEYFNNYFLHLSDVTIDISKNRMEVHQHAGEPWRVTLIDTGDETMTGGRLKRVQNYLRDEREFCFTYGDGVADVDIRKLVDFHHKQGTHATITAAQPPGRFGALDIEGNKVLSFQEKPQGDGGWINAGFFVLTPKVFDYIEDDATIWERDPLEKLASEGELSVYLHRGFWQPMDTLRDKNQLEELWSSGRAPWKLWK